MRTIIINENENDNENGENNNNNHSNNLNNNNLKLHILGVKLVFWFMVVIMVGIENELKGKKIK